MKRYTPAVVSPPRPILQSTVHNPSITTPRVSGVIHSNRSIQSSHPIHLPGPQRFSTSLAHGIHHNTVRHPTYHHHQRVEPIVYGPQIIPPFKTNQFNGVYTTPTLAVLSDKQIPIVGNYVSNQPKLTAYIQDINPPHIQQPLATKVVQATLKDIIPPEIIKITAENTGGFEARGSQAGAFDVPQSLEDIAYRRNRARSYNHLPGSSTSIVGDNIKVSVYRSPDVIIKERQLITDGPKLQKQHVLRVGVQGHAVPTYRPQNHQSIHVRDLTLNKQQTVIVHEPRLALQLLPPPKTTIQQNFYQIKPTITSVTLPTVPVPVFNTIQDSYQVETLGTFDYANNSHYRQNIAPIVHSKYIETTTVQNVPLTTSQFTSPYIRDMMTKKTTPIKDLSAGGAGRQDDSLDKTYIQCNVGDNFEHSLQRQTNSFYINSETPLAGLAYKIHDQHVGNEYEIKDTFSSKLPQGKITQPLSFAPTTFQTQTRPHVGSNLHPQNLREPGSYEGPPIRANDPNRELMD